MNRQITPEYFAKVNVSGHISEHTERCPKHGKVSCSYFLTPKPNSGAQARYVCFLCVDELKKLTADPNRVDITANIHAIRFEQSDRVGARLYYRNEPMPIIMVQTEVDGGRWSPVASRWTNGQDENLETAVEFAKAMAWAVEEMRRLTNGEPRL